MNIELDVIDQDASIQCRASIDMAVVDDYAKGMVAGDKFPPVEVFGTRAQCWIGDGWHRVFAARKINAKTIAAKLEPGGRVAALKHALGANATQGARRTNADKRRCVEIALREFPKLSSRAVATMCGVGVDMVIAHRPQVSESDTCVNRTTGQDGKQYPPQVSESDTCINRTTLSSPDHSPTGTPRNLVVVYGNSKTATTTGQDGKQYPARREAPPIEEPEIVELPESQALRRLGPPANGLQFARMAIMDLEQIRTDDVERNQALAFVREWLDEHA
jgi:hypothetical protein